MNDNRITKAEYLEDVREEYQRKRARVWYVLYPGQAYANDIELDEPGTLSDAIDYALSWQGTDTLPAGVKFWAD